MITAGIALIIGFMGLIWSADRFVAGAAGIASGLGMAPIMIGLTIVALGTSAPEILVSVSASLDDAGSLAVGNALGSNLANIGLVLGITALVSPIPISFALLKREIPLLLLATLAAGFFLHDGFLGSVDGIAFLLMLAAIFSYLVKSKSAQPDVELEVDVEHLPHDPMGKSWLLFVIGLGLLIASSEILVWGAKEIATGFGVSELIIGLTVVAIGTSLPELAATVASALKGHHDIALGNIVGSNLFNLLAVMAMPALLSPTQFEPEVFNRDYIAMAALTFMLALMLFGHKLLYAAQSRATQSAEQPKNRAFIGRLEGVLLLIAYGTYYYFLFPTT